MARSERRLLAVLVAAVALLLAVYVLGYVAGSDFQAGRPDAPDYRQRTFRRQWQCLLYRPAAWAESVLCREPVETAYRLSRHRFQQYDVVGDPQYRIRAGGFSPGSSSP